MAGIFCHVTRGLGLRCCGAGMQLLDTTPSFIQGNIDCQFLEFVCTMDARTDIRLTPGDTSRNALAENVSVVHENEPSSITFNENSVSGNLPISNVYPDTVTDSDDAYMQSDHEYPGIQPVGHETNHEQGCIAPRSDSIQVVFPDEVFSSELPEIPAGGATSAINVNDHPEVPTTVYSQELPSLRLRTVSETSGKREGDADPDPLNCVQILHTELDCVPDPNLPLLTDEEEIRDDLDDSCGHFPSSLPPSSSPPQLFSSSPCASSQSSVSDGVEPSKSVLVVEVEGFATSCDCSYTNHVALVAQDESRLESERLHARGTDVTTPPEANDNFLEMDSTSYVESSTGLSKKRMTYQSDAGGSHGSQPTKRPDSNLYLPPTPMRATLASQSRQFKKLAAPFRPPSKLPVARDELVQTTNGAIDSTSSSTPEINHDKPDAKELTAQVSPLQHKASRSAAQFKSPLVNRVLPADTRTIRLTPAVQALERKLQLLKRAIKIKDGNEEEVLSRLAGKWIEAGREVAYDVWDATKDTGDFGGKATVVRRSYGWESSNDGNMSWGWDNKLGDGGEASGDPDPSMASCVTGRPIPEEDDEVCLDNTLGTMLRQLGIAPEIFGWDDDKEAFSD